MKLPGLLTAVFFVAVGTAAAPQPSAEPPADFAFRFESKPCATTTIETYTHTYTRVATNEQTISMPLTLSPQQMSAVYREIVNIRFFDYQPDFKRFVPGPGGEVTTTTPSTSYRLEVRSAGVIHTVAYDDQATPRSEEANRLLNLFKLIDGFIDNHPDVKRLPGPRFPCM